MKLLNNRRLWQVVLSAMLVSLAFVAYWPSPVDRPIQGQLAEILNFLHGIGIPRWLNYELIEAGANVVLFMPLGMVSTLALPEKRWWQVAALGLLISSCMELGQLVFLHNRFSSTLDLMTNTSGTVMGVPVATLFARKMKGL